MFVGYVGPFEPGLFLGTQEAARNERWLKHVDVGVLVRCKRTHAPNNTGIPEIDASVVDTGLSDENSLKTMAATLIALSGDINEAHEAGTRNVLFWCKAGRHRSAAVLAAYLLIHSPGLTAENICGRLSTLKKDVQFFEDIRVVGGHARPPMLPMLRIMDDMLWGMWNRQIAEP